MKITKSFIKQIIKEELAKIVKLDENIDDQKERDSLRQTGFNENEITDIFSIRTAINSLSISGSDQMRRDISNRINNNKSQKVKDYFSGKFK